MSISESASCTSTRASNSDAPLCKRLKLDEAGDDVNAGGASTVPEASSSSSRRKLAAAAASSNNNYENHDKADDVDMLKVTETASAVSAVETDLCVSSSTSDTYSDNTTKPAAAGGGDVSTSSAVNKESSGINNCASSSNSNSLVDTEKPRALSAQQTLTSVPPTTTTPTAATTTTITVVQLWLLTVTALPEPPSLVETLMSRYIRANSMYWDTMQCVEWPIQIFYSLDWAASVLR